MEKPLKKTIWITTLTMIIGIIILIIITTYPPRTPLYNDACYWADFTNYSGQWNHTHHCIVANQNHPVEMKCAEPQHPNLLNPCTRYKAIKK